jgi:prepilin-type processing-associated H-X9-DG protein
MGNMFAIGVTESVLPIQSEVVPKRLAAMLDPTRAKLFTDVGLNWQAVFVMAAFEHPAYPAPVIPVPVHRKSLNVVMADGHTPAADQSRLAFGHTEHPLTTAGAATVLACACTLRRHR